MDTNTATVESPKAPAKKTVKKPAGKAAPSVKGSAKKTPAKKVASKAEKAAPTERVAEYGIEKSKDLPWNPKKVAIFKALKALGAVKSLSAVSADAVAEKASTKDLTISTRDVRHYCYHAKVSGLTDIATEIEGVRGYAFHLTDKGAKVDPIAELKAAQAKKTAKGE